MAADIELQVDAISVVINKNATLATGSRAAGDYDNSTNNSLVCNALIKVQWNTTAPADGVFIANLWVLPGDGAGTEKFPIGGDGTVGTDFEPSNQLFVGAFECVDASITLDREYMVRDIRLTPHTNRFVLLNTSGFEFDLTWQLDLLPYKIQST